MLSELLNQTVSVYERVSYNRYGKATFDTPSTYSARVEQKLKRRLDPRGEVVTTNAKIIFDGSPNITTESKITYGDITYRPVFINQAVDGDGNVHHLSVEVSLWQTT